MDYNKFLSGEDIPTIRRLDKIVRDISGRESGTLYAALRNLGYLKKYCSDKLTDENKEKIFASECGFTEPRLTWVNQWMKAYGKEEIFSNINDWKSVGEDYDYYWCLRTKEQYEKEEEDARAGRSKRKPVENYDNSIKKQTPTDLHDDISL